MLEKIIDLLPSDALKSKIRQSGWQFSHTDLLQIIYRYAPAFDDRISMLTAFADVAPSDVSDAATAYIKLETQSYKSFCSRTSDCVYELHIKDVPGAYDERYLCADYESALSYIDLFYDEYADIGVKETDKTRYTIVKRHVFSNGTGQCFSEDLRGECLLGKGKTLITVDVQEAFKSLFSCDGQCSVCGKICPHRAGEVQYPCFLSDRDVIKYTDDEGAEHFGVCRGFRGPETSDRIFVTPLEADFIRLRGFDEDNHLHIEAPLVDVAYPDELDDTTRDCYAALIAYLDGKR